MGASWPRAPRWLQAWWYLRASVRPRDREWALAHLPLELGPLFLGMGVQDQAHALRVARRLDEAGAPDPCLCAALLHDCGKPAGYGLAARSLGVLLAARAASMPREPMPLGWLGQALHCYRWHGELGLERLLEAGADEACLGLVRALEGKGEAPAGMEGWLALLKSADDAG